MGAWGSGADGLLQVVPRTFECAVTIGVAIGSNIDFLGGCGEGLGGNPSTLGDIGRVINGRFDCSRLNHDLSDISIAGTAHETETYVACTVKICLGAVALGSRATRRNLVKLLPCATVNRVTDSQFVAAARAPVNSNLARVINSRSDEIGRSAAGEGKLLHDTVLLEFHLQRLPLTRRKRQRLFTAGAILGLGQCAEVFCDICCLGHEGTEQQRDTR